ncbi:A/G-specific adenine glycosylase, partial [Nocardioides sp. NPDC000441]
RKVQTWAGTDRQCRGRLMAVLRDADSPVHRSLLDVVWSDDTQRRRALEGLLKDNLATEVEPDFFALP